MQRQQGFPIPTTIPAVNIAYRSEQLFPADDDLYIYLRTTHPPQNPGWLKDDEYHALAAYLFTIAGRQLPDSKTSQPALTVPGLTVISFAALLVGILLFMDIGRWNQFYNIFVPGFINLHSFLEEVSLCVTLFAGILVLEIAPVFLEKWGYKTPIRWIERGIFIIAGAGIVLSMLHQSSLGSLFLLMPHKLHPLWWTPALPLLFYLQAVYTGLGATAIADEDALTLCSTKHAPWYVVPSNNRFVRDVAVSELMLATLREMDPQIPRTGEDVARLSALLRLKPGKATRSGT